MVKKEETAKSTTKKLPAPKAAAVRKPKAPAKKAPAHVAEKPEKHEKAPAKVLGRYVFATGRRKTAVANVRLYPGKGESTVNRKPFEKYFFNGIYRDFALKPLSITGQANDFFFFASISGGGINAQAQALQHGLAQALAITNQDLRKQLKKNSFLTRDDRKKERKKPGLKRARRSPQWAKR